MSAYSFSAHGLAMRKIPQGVLDTVNQLLFDAGQVGGNLPFSDFSKIWQDSAGTTPYTTVEQYAGLLLNKAVPQVSNGTARVNIAVDSANFASTATCVITNNKFVATAASGYHSYKSVTLSASVVCKIKVKVKAAEYTKLYLNDGANGAFYTSVDLVAKTYSGSGGSATAITVIDIGGGVVEIQMTATASVSGSWVTIIGYPDTGATLNAYGAQYTGDGVSGLYVYAVDVRLLSNEAVLPAYQRIDNNVWVPYSSGCFYQATGAARPVVSARVNRVTNTGFSGGVAGAPGTAATGFTQFITGSPSAYYPTSTYDASSKSLRVVGGVGDRYQYSQTISIGAYENILATVNVDNVYTAAAVYQHITALSVPAGAAVSFYLDGVSVSGPTILPSGAHTISALVTNAGTSGTFILRFGAGLQVGLTLAADITFSNPRAVPLQSKLPFQRVNTSTDYDTIGFPDYLKFDGIDDNLVSAAGGGGAAGIYFCGAIQFNKVGAVQTIFSDAGTNSGYKLRLTAANQLEISAGNGTAYTAINTTATFAAADVSLVELWDDGTNLGVRLGEGTPVTVARPVVTAGTAQITIGKDNNAASNYAGIGMFEPVWRYGAMPNATQREAIRAICRSKAGIA